MIETAENVWSDASVCAMVDNDLKGTLDDPDSHDDMPQFHGASVSYTHLSIAVCTNVF